MASVARSKAERNPRLFHVIFRIGDEDASDCTGPGSGKEVDARRAEVESALVDELSPLAADIQVEPPSSERVVCTAQLLVRRQDRPALDERVRALGDALAGLMAFRYVGPLPPYSFADMSLDEDDG
jgi:hypothetical protein